MEAKTSKWIILIIVVMSTFMACLDGSIVNVALPVMADALRVSSAAVQWVVTSYLIVISASILVFGRLGDMAGKTNVFKFGILLFSIGSLLCGITRSLAVLVLARVIQAIGAAGTMANSQGIVTETFPPQERGRALGIVGTFVALGSLVGPPLGGLIVHAFSWEYIFLINVPIGILTFIFGMKILPKRDREPSETVKVKLDTLGAGLFMVSIVSLFFSLGQGVEVGFAQPYIIAGFFITAAAFAAFLFTEKKQSQPLLQLQIFKNGLFSLSLFCGFISFVAIFCSSIIQPFYLENVMGYREDFAGYILMVYPLILAVVAPLSGHFSDKVGSEILTFIGLLLTSIGLFLMATLNEYSSVASMVLFTAVMSVGNGLFQSPNNSLVMSTVPKEKLGIAGSVNALVRNLGMICGITLATTILYGRMSSILGYRVSGYEPGHNDVFVAGMRAAYITAAVICLIGAVLTAFRLYKRKPNLQTDSE